MRGLPPVQRERPRAMDEFVARLQSSKGGAPSAGEVGMALRTLVW